MDVTSYLLGKKSSGGGGGGGVTTDWSQIGYTSEPTSVINGINYAKSIANNWDDTTTSMYNLYSNNEQLLFFPAINTSNVIDMQNTFLNSGLLEIPVIDTSNVTNMSGTFQSTKIATLPSIDTGACTDMQNFCRGCNTLISVPNIDTKNVKNFFASFNGCPLLKDIPILNAIKVNNDGLRVMFTSCPSLSNESLNNIMKMCITAKNGNYNTKTLAHLGLSSSQATICQTLSNYDDFIAAGWTTGY